jgi:succinate dehydrogenase hydrophobic anchor subunit
MNLLLYPDKSTKLYSIYHKGATFLIPGMGINVLANRNSDVIPYIGAITIPSICQLTFHSHFSVVNVLQDYIKHSGLQRGLRVGSLTFHGLAAVGFIYSALNPLKKDV